MYANEQARIEQETLKKVPAELLRVIMAAEVTGTVHHITRYNGRNDRQGYRVFSVTASEGAVESVRERDGRMLDEKTARELTGEYASGSHMFSFDVAPTQNRFWESLHAIGRTLRQDKVGEKVIYHLTSPAKSKHG